MATSNDDWRRDYPHLAFLDGLEFHRARYVQPSPEWNHDHCAFCHRRFAEPGIYDDAISEGWTDVERTHFWICDDCFKYFSEHYGWRERS